MNRAPLALNIIYLFLSLSAYAADAPTSKQDPSPYSVCFNVAPPNGLSARSDPATPRLAIRENRHAFLTLLESFTGDNDKKVKKEISSASFYPDGLKKESILEDINRNNVIRSECKDITKEETVKCLGWIKNQFQAYRKPSPRQTAPRLTGLGTLFAPPPSSGKGDPWKIWGNNCADFVIRGWKECTGETLRSSSIPFSILPITDPLSLRRPSRSR